VQHQLLGAPALRAQETFHRERAVQPRPGEQARLHVEGNGGDLGAHLSFGSGFDQLGFVAQPELEGRDACGRVPQRSELDQPSADPDLVQAAGASAGFASAGRGSAPRSIMDLDFSSFIIGEGAVTALVILTIRWRSTASLNLNECSSSLTVS